MKKNALAKKHVFQIITYQILKTVTLYQSIETFAKICNALNITPDYLLLGALKSNNIPQNIVDKLNLCDEKSLKLISKIIYRVLTEQE